MVHDFRIKLCFRNILLLESLGEKKKKKKKIGGCCFAKLVATLLSITEFYWKCVFSLPFEVSVLI